MCLSDKHLGLQLAQQMGHLANVVFASFYNSIQDERSITRNGDVS